VSYAIYMEGTRVKASACRWQPRTKADAIAAARQASRSIKGAAVIVEGPGGGVWKFKEGEALK